MDPLDLRLSRYGQASTTASPVSRMMAAFAGDFRDGIDINLGVGYVNEATIPSARLVEALEAVTANPGRYRQAFNYGSPEGSANLIASLRRFLARPGAPLDAETLARRRLLIGPSGATSILEALADLLAPGLVVTSDPMYYIYCDALERKGFTVLAIPEDEDGPSLSRLERRLAELGAAGRERLAFFYFVTVNNPSCTILSDERRRALAGVAARLSREQGRAIPVFFDLAYELLIHDPAVPRPASALPEDELGLVYEIGTLSKVLAPALRMGYLLGPDGPLMNAVAQKTSDVGFSAPLFAQEMASYLLDHCVAEQIDSVNAGYREKAAAVRAAIERELGPLLENCAGGHAGFYFYLTFREIETHDQSRFFRHLTRTSGNPAIDREGFARTIDRKGAASAIGRESSTPSAPLRPRVIYVPGQYCVHPCGELTQAGRRQLRLSYGFEEVPAIERALTLMREAAQAAAD